MMHQRKGEEEKCQGARDVKTRIINHTPSVLQNILGVPYIGN